MYRTVTPEAATAPPTPGQHLAGPLAQFLGLYLDQVMDDDGNIMRATDQAHLAVDQAHAERTHHHQNLTVPEAFADRVLSTVVFLMGEAVKISPDPAGTLRALHVALNLTTEEG